MELDVFTDGIADVLVQENLYEETVSDSGLQYLMVMDVPFTQASDVLVHGMFIGFGTVGVALLVSLGISVILRIFRAA